MFKFCKTTLYERGATLVDYALILMFVAIAALGGMVLLGSGVNSGMNNVSASIQRPEVISALYEDSFDRKAGTNLEWDQIWGKWKIDRHGWFRSRKKWAKAVTYVQSPDYEFSLDLQTLTKKRKRPWEVSRVIFRFQDPDNYYAVVPKRDGTLELAKMQNGEWHPWLQSAYTGAKPTNSHNFKVRVQGNRISVWQDGIRVIDYTDPNPIPSGGLGVSNEHTAGRFDNVQIKVFNPDDTQDN